MEEIRIIAKIHVKKEFKGIVEEFLKKLVSESRKEDGNISYDLTVDISNPLVYCIIECWKSKADIDFHNNTPHFKEFISVIEGKTDEIAINILKQVI